MFSGIRWMRLIVFYDLPVSTPHFRRNYQLFHNFIIKDGYDMLQYSVYCRLCNGHDSVNKFLKRLQENAPPRGNVRVMKITEKQYSEMQFIVGKPTIQEKITKKNKQLMLF